MRIAHVIKVVGIAGAERHLLMLLAGLRAHGEDAQIILLVEPHNPMDEFVQAAAEREIPLARIPIRSHVDVGLVRRLRAAFHEMQPDIVHTHLLHADVFGIPAARLARVPVVVSTRHNDNAFRRRALIRLTNRWLWGRLTAGIAISESLRRFCIEVEGAPPGKVQTIHYGLDAKPNDAQRAANRAAFRAELGLNADTPLVGVVCRLIEQKGVRYGLEAFAQVAPEFPAAQLVIAGDGGLKTTLEAQARSLGLEARIRFLGWREDTTRVMAGLDVLMQSSLWEGFGLVLLEAMAQRLPIVASDVSAIPEIVANGVTGLLAPPRDVPRLAGALRTLLGDGPLRQHMGLLGEDRLEEHFTAGRMVDQTLALYRQLLQRRRR